MNTYEYLFNRTMQNMQEEIDKQKFQKELNQKRELAALELLQNSLQFLSKYGYQFEIKKNSCSQLLYYLEIEVPKEIERNCFYYEYLVEEDMYRTKYGEKKQTIDDIITDIAKYTFEKMNGRKKIE